MNDSADLTDEPAELAHAADRVRSGDLEGARQAYDSLLRRSPVELDGRHRGAALLGRAMVRQAAGEESPAVADLCGAFSALREAGHEWLCAGLRAAAAMLAEGGRLEEAASLLETALEMAEVGGRPGDQAAVLGELGLLASRRGHREEARGLWEQSVDAAGRPPVEAAALSSLVNLAGLALEAGQTEEAARLLATVAEHGRAGLHVGPAAGLCAELAEACLRDGRWAEAEERLDTAARLRRIDGDRIALAAALNDLGAVALEAGHPDAATPAWEECLELANAEHLRALALSALRGLAELARGMGHGMQALAYTRQAARLLSGETEHLMVARLAASLGDDARRGAEVSLSAECYLVAAEGYRGAGRSRIADVLDGVVATLRSRRRLRREEMKRLEGAKALASRLETEAG